MKNSLIAIIGIGCRFPGGASSPGAFWNLLKNGVDAIVDVPGDRWDMRRFYDPDTEKPGKVHSKQGGFLKEKIEDFDPLFFGISPREAETLDPQQRILLEITYEAIEDAGLQVEKLKGSPTGVFIGGFALDNKLLHLGVFNRHLLNSLSATNGTMAMLSNRIAYTFDLMGPAISMDTACSSSLVTVHAACQSIWNGDCEIAIAGGVNVMFQPGYFIVLSKGYFISKESRSKAFDADASGYARGEGAGVVILKPYEQALNDQDNIYAVIKAIALNQDGQTTGITVPNPLAQTQLMRKVYKQAGIDVNQLHYIEAHGTGTPVGDPIEMKALSEVLAEKRAPENKCPVGSVKTNIGHLEAGSGIAGLIKTALVLYHQQVPPNLHFNKPNPELDFNKMPIKIVTQLEDLPGDEISHAAVNSFGYGGTNAHVVLQETPKKTEQGTANKIKTPWLFPISARDDQALKDLAGKYYDFIVNKKPSLNDLIYSASFRRSHHKNRLVITAGSREQLIESLKSYSEGVLLKGTVENQANIEQKPRLVFVYTGMGPQWWAMGRELKKKEPVFRKIIEECESIFSKLGEWSILEQMEVDEEHSQIGKSNVSQPLSFVIQAALTELLKHYGIEPDVVVGHSAGEFASAYGAGALSLEEALLVAYHRSRLQQTTAGQGTMLAIGLGETETNELIQFFDDVSIAAVNSPSSITLSGNGDSLRQIADLLEVKEVFNRMLKVDLPYHSHLMDPLREPLVQALQILKPKDSGIPFYSTVTGERVPGSQLGADYWWDNVRQPVRFADAFQTIINDGYSIFLEIGPHPVLKNYMNECLDGTGKEGRLVQTLNRKEPELPQFYEGLAKLFTLGFDIRWQRISPRGNTIKLPAYPWQKEHHWFESSLSRQDRFGLPGSVFLNNRVQSPNPAWEVELNQFFFPFINDHIVQNSVVLPGATYVAAGLALSEKELGNNRTITLEDIQFKQILPIDGSRVQMLRTVMDPETSTYSVYSRFNEDEAGWKLHAAGRMLKMPVLDTAPGINIDEIKARCAAQVTPGELYKKLASAKLEYGPYFRTVKEAWKGDGEMIAKISANESSTRDTDNNNNTNDYLIHPTVLDGSFQTLVVFGDKEMVPVHIGRVHFFQSPGNQCWSYIKVKQITGNSITGEIKLCDEKGSTVVEIEDLVCREIVRRDIREEDKMKEWFYDFQWQEADGIPPTAKTKPGRSRWLLFADESEYRDQLSSRLAAANVDCTLITRGDQYKKLADHHYQIPGDRPEDMRRLIADTAGLKFPGVLYLWGTETVKDTGLSDTVNQCMPLVYLAQALAKVRPDEEVTIDIVTRGSQIAVPGDKGDTGLAASPLWGLGHQLRNEFPFIAPKTIDLESKEDWRHNPPKEEIQLLVNELLPGNTDEDAALRGNKRLVKSLKKASMFNEEDNKKYKMVSTDTPVELAIRFHGKIENLYYREIQREKPGPDEITVKIHAVPLNYKDLLNVLGKIPAKVVENTYMKDALGLEAGGVVVETGSQVTDFKTGDEVVVICSSGNFKSYITLEAERAIHKPNALSHAEAVILIPYLTVLYGLEVVAQLQKGEKILIHNATGGVGLAAVQYAKWKGAEIYATAGTPEKREYLKSIGIKHVMDSRTLQFAGKIKEVTNGYGVDVVLNAIAGEALFQSFSLLANYGRFIEIGKKDIADNSGLPMEVFNRGVTFAAVDINRILLDRKELIQKLSKDIYTGFERGYFQALPTRVFPAAKAVDAFRMIARAKHTGKIVLDFHNREVEVEAGTDTFIEHNATYLITGGTKGFGLEIAKWLSASGAGNIVLIGRRGAQTDEAAEAINQMKQQGTEVSVYAVDITEEKDVKELIENITATMPRLTGIFHLAMVLDDAFIVDVKKERFEKVMAPKVGGVLNLHKYTRHLPLDYFICMSSIASLVGNPGQAAYVAANAFLDAFAHYRAAQGLVATTINLGILGETGVVSRNSGVASMLEGTGLKSFSTKEALAALQIIMEQKPVQVGLFNIDWKLWAQAAPISSTSSRFKTLTGKENDAGSLSEKQKQLIEQLTNMSTKEKKEFMEKILAEEMAKILGLLPGKVERNRGINFLGVDSIMVVEFVRAIYKRIEFEISTVELLNGPTISQLAVSLLKRLDN